MTAIIFPALRDLAPAFADHLWQSTLFALAAGLLTLALRRNSARIRYGIWLAASLKFLVPFSLLTSLGSLLTWRHASASSGGTYIISQFSQPFTQALPAARSAALPDMATRTLPWQPFVLAVWLIGFVIVLSIWIARWRRVSSAIRQATASTEGREATILRRLERLAGMSANLPVLISPLSLEPGVFGIFRHVLLWPRTMSDHLDDAHLEAVVAHELCHVQRRDNLAAVLHMLVEAIFWFHPLVWWLGSRLIHERERACDEAVVELGSQREVYAESILKICEFCLRCPLACVSGVTGADLKKRMVHIMTHSIAHKLNFTRKLLLWTAALLAFTLPISLGLLKPTPSRAESPGGTTAKFGNVSVRPHPPEPDGVNRSKIMLSLEDASFTAADVTPQTLVQVAYHAQHTEIAGAPGWFSSQKYDIDAKVDQSMAEEIARLTEDQRGALGVRMLRQLLTDQFKLSLHQESRDLPVYELVIAQGGAKVQRTYGRTAAMHTNPGGLISQGTPLALLAAQLSQHLGRTVLDKTGLEGTYSYTLRWTPDSEEQMRLRDQEPTTPQTRSDGSAPPLLTAVQEQLGLKLQPKTDRVQVLVIDHAEQPDQN